MNLLQNSNDRSKSNVISYGKSIYPDILNSIDVAENELLELRLMDSMIEEEDIEQGLPELKLTKHGFKNTLVEDKSTSQLKSNNEDTSLLKEANFKSNQNFVASMNNARS
jgi:hypothetical protein